MAKVLTVEMGASLIRFCEVDYKAKNPKVYRKFTVTTPEDTQREDSLTINEELVDAIKTAMSQNRVGTKQLVFVLNSTKIASNEVVIPFVKENRVADVIRSNASDFFPVDLNQYELGHCITDTIENNNKKQYKVMVYAVPKSLIDSYRNLASLLGCTITAFDYSGNSIYQLVKDVETEGTQMIVKLDEMSSNVTILKNQVVVLQRNITYGINDLVEPIRKAEICKTNTYEEALEILCQKNCLEAKATDSENGLQIEDLDHPSDLSEGVQREIAVSMKALASALSRVTDFYHSRVAEAPIDRIYIAGIGGDVLGLPEYVESLINVPVEALTDVSHYNIERDFKDEYIGRYLSCLGAAIAPVGFVSEDANRKVQLVSSNKEKETQTVCMLLFIGGIAIAVVLAVISIVNLSLAKKENEKLNNRIAELEPVKQIYQDYLQQQYTYDKLNYMYGSTVTPNENFITFLEEMEEKMPSSLNVQAMTASEEGISLSATVADKKSAAMLIQQFRTFDSIADVSVTSITDSGAVQGTEATDVEGMVSFSVNLTYHTTAEEPEEAPAEEQTEEAVEDEAADVE